MDKALADAARRNFEQIGGSRYFCVIWHEQMVEEVLPLLQMGLAVYLDKPIAILVPKGTGPIPMNLRRLAVSVIEFDPRDDASLEQAAAQLAQQLRPIGGGERG